jgi:shikimate kinase
MIGEAKAMGAITLVSALASGKGATVSVMLPTVAKVQVKKEKGHWRVSLNGERSQSALAETTVLRTIKMLRKNPNEYSGSIDTKTSAPVGVGLKTSSSSSVAIALATVSAFGKSSYKARDILGCSVSSSLASGVSVTGALDDAASCLLGGVNFTDNSKGRVLSSDRLGEPRMVVVKVPRGRSRRATVDRAYLRRFSKVADSIFAIGREGGVWKAMTLNGLLYSSIYGYNLGDALGALEAGAEGAGLSGTGPAVAAVCDDRESAGRVARIWEDGHANVIVTETSDGGAKIGI